MGINHLCYHPNKNIVVPICSSYPPKNDGTNDCSAAIIALNKTSPVSNPTPANQAHTDINNDNDSQFLQPPENTITVTLTRVIQILQLTWFSLMYIKVYANRFLQLQQHHWKSLHFKNSILVFKWIENVLMHNSVPN